MRMNILVTGATGYVGRLLAWKLVEAGHNVRCMIRDVKKLDPGLLEHVEPIEADVLDAESLIPCLENIDCAYYLIHSMGSNDGQFKKIDRKAALNFGTVCNSQKVKRIIYLGGLGAKEDKLSEHLRSRQETGEILRKSGVDVTEFRAGSIVGSGSLSFEMVRYLVERLPVLICPRWVKGITQPISIDDILKYLVQCLEIPESKGRIFEVGGRDKLSYQEMMQTYAQIRGLKRYFINVPVLTPKLSSHWLGLVTPLPVKIAKPLVHGITNDLYARCDAADAIFKFEKDDFATAVKTALTEHRENLIRNGISTAVYKYNKDKRRKMTVEKAEGLIIERWKRNSKLSPSELFSSISQCGGASGWPAGSKRIRFRMFLDRLLGGEAHPRRPTKELLEHGDCIDFFKVIYVEKDKRIIFRDDNIRLPGRVWLDIKLIPASSGTDYHQTLFYEAFGLWGFIYYFLLQKPHKDLYTELANAISTR